MLNFTMAVPVNPMRWVTFTFVAAASIACAGFPVLAQPLDGDIASGGQIANTQCSSCHRVMPMTFADKADPPSFQSIADLPSTTGLSLNVFLHSNHENMPNLILSHADSDDIIAYILSLKK